MTKMKSKSKQKSNVDRLEPFLLHSQSNPTENNISFSHFETEFFLLFSRVSWNSTMFLYVLIICLKAHRVPLELNIRYSSLLGPYARAHSRTHSFCFILRRNMANHRVNEWYRDLSFFVFAFLLCALFIWRLVCTLFFFALILSAWECDRAHTSLHLARTLNSKKSVRISWGAKGATSIAQTYGWERRKWLQGVQW